MKFYRAKYTGRGAQVYEDHHGGGGKERVLQFWTVINMTMGNTLYKKRNTQ